MKIWRSGLLSMLLVVPLVFAACGTDPGGGANYPEKGIEYVVPFAAGGGVDLVARGVAEQLSREWGQPVSVVNKPGGGGAVGAEAVLLGAAKDGYTVLADNVSSTSMLEGGMKSPPVTLEDRILVGRVVLDPIAYAVKADAPWKDFKEFSAWAKANPGELTWTSVGPAGTSAFGVADWMNAIGADFAKSRMVATKGASDSVPKVAGGHAVLAVHTVAEMHAMHQAGKIRILAVAADARSPFLPDVPTLKEQGVDGVTTKWWTGVTLPKGTPAAVVDKWETALAKLVQDPAFLAKMKGMNMEVSYLNSADFTKFVEEERTYYTKLATERGMRK